MGTAEKKGYRTQIIIALIGVAGVLGAAVFSNWDKIFKIEPDETAPLPKPDKEPDETAPLPKLGDVETNSFDMKLVYFPAGSFMRKIGGYSIIEKAFWMGQTEVTKSQYFSVMKDKQPSSDDGKYPAIDVLWNDANQFCKELTREEKKETETKYEYRLPTEDEWEWAAGAGKREYPWGDKEPTDKLANYGQNVRATTPVGSYPDGATPEGLMDMAGNVWEWCNDWYEVGGTRRSARGGCGNSPFPDLRCSWRFWGYPGTSSGWVGFRVVRSQP